MYIPNWNVSWSICKVPNTYSRYSWQPLHSRHLTKLLICSSSYSSILSPIFRHWYLSTNILSLSPFLSLTCTILPHCQIFQYAFQTNHSTSHSAKSTRQSPSDSTNYMRCQWSPWGMEMFPKFTSIWDLGNLGNATETEFIEDFSHPFCRGMFPLNISHYFVITNALWCPCSQ